MTLHFLKLVSLISVLSFFYTAPSYAKDAEQCEGYSFGSDPTGNYDFKLGKWQLQWKVNPPVSRAPVEFEGTLHAYWILEGAALLDDARNMYYKGTTYRTYSPSEGKWGVQWLAANTTDVISITARLEGCDLLERYDGVGNDGRPYTTVTKFINITEDSFTFKQDWSFDGGETWLESVLEYDAIRIE